MNKLKFNGTSIWERSVHVCLYDVLSVHCQKMVFWCLAFGRIVAMLVVHANQWCMYTCVLYLCKLPNNRMTNKCQCLGIELSSTLLLFCFLLFSVWFGWVWRKYCALVISNYLRPQKNTLAHTWTHRSKKNITNGKWPESRMNNAFSLLTWLNLMAKIKSI